MTGRWSAVVLVAFAALGIVLVVTDDVNDDRVESPLDDAPLGDSNEAARRIWTSPDGFTTVAAFCVGVNGVYTHDGDGPPVVVVSDPNCADGGILLGGNG